MVKRYSHATQKFSTCSATRTNFGGWYQPGLAAVERLVKQNGFDAILSTSPPRVPTLLQHTSRGVTVSRGSWTCAIRVRGVGIRKCKLIGSELFYRRLFLKCARQASAIVVNTERFRDCLKAEHPELAGKVRRHPNGCTVEQASEVTNEVLPATFFYRALW